MLYRSLYFLFRDEQSVRSAINELETRLGLDDVQLHAITNEGHTLVELPGTTVHQKSPAAIRTEKLLWYVTVIIFVAALIATAITLLAASWYLAVLFGIVVVGMQLSGYLFGNRIPNAQLDRFRHGIEQGYIVLQVDVPTNQVKQVREFLAKQYPESTTNISNWHMGAFGH